MGLGGVPYSQKLLGGRYLTEEPDVPGLGGAVPLPPAALSQ